MAPISSIFRPRDVPPTDNAVTYNLLIALTVIFFVGCLCLGALLILKKFRRGRRSARLESSDASQSHRRTRHTASISIVTEKSAFLEDEARSPSESVPEIRITFPDECNAQGKRQSRVVVVKIGDGGSIGYEPYQEPLPVYKEKESSCFRDLDLERIGGLKEKEMAA